MLKTCWNPRKKPVSSLENWAPSIRCDGLRDIEIAPASPDTDAPAANAISERMDVLREDATAARSTPAPITVWLQTRGIWLYYLLLGFNMRELCQIPIPVLDILGWWSQFIEACRITGACVLWRCSIFAATNFDGASSTSSWRHSQSCCVRVLNQRCCFVFTTNTIL